MSTTDLTIILRIRNEAMAALEATKRKLVEITETGKGVGAGGFPQLSAGINGTLSVTDRLTGAVKGLAVGLLGLGVVRTLKDFADTAARTQVLGTVLGVVAVNAGISTKEIVKTDLAVQKLGITASSSRTALTAMIQAGLDIKFAAPLARAAQDLAVIAGKNSSELFQNIILNIQQLDVVGLRYNGVVLDMDQVMADYAKTLGTTAAALSNTQRQQAVLQGALEKGKEVAGVYERSLGDVGKQLQSLARYQEEAKVSVGNNLLPAYRVLVEEFTLFLKQSKLVTDQWSDQSSGAKKLAEAIKPIAAAIREASLFVVEHIQLISQMVAAYLGLRALSSVLALVGVLGGMLKTVWTYGTAAVSAIRGMGLALTLLGVSNPVILGIVAVIGLLSVGLGYAAKKWMEMKSAKEEALKKTGDVDLTQDALGLQDQLSKKLTERLELEAKIANAQSEVLDARAANNAAGLKNAEDNLAEGKKRQAQLEKEVQLLKDELARKGGASAITAAEDDSAENARKKKILDNIKDIQTKLKELKLDSEGALKGLSVSKEFESTKGQVVSILNDFTNKTVGLNGKQQVSFGLAYLSIKKLVGEAKSFDELTVALRTVENATNSMGAAWAKDLIDTAKMKRAQTGLKEVDSAIEGYTTKVKKTSEVQAIINAALDESAKFTASFKEALAAIGPDIVVASDGMLSFAGSLSGVSASMQEVKLAEANSLSVSAAASAARYADELLQLQKVHDKRKEFINSDINSNRDRKTLLVEAERDFARQSLDIQKKRLDELRSQQQKYADIVKTEYSKMAELERSIKTSQRSEAQDLYDIRISGLTGMAAKQEQFNQLSRLGFEAEAANASKNFDLEKNIYSERIALAKQIATASDSSPAQKQAATRILQESYAMQRKAEQDLADAAAKRAQEAIQAQNEMTQAIKGMTTAMQQMGKQTELEVTVNRSAYDKWLEDVKSGATVDLTVKLFDNATTLLRDQLSQGLQNIPVTFSGSADAQRHADGGYIRGPGTGTSDSILMFGSNGEFMMREAAVRKYGLSFMESVNAGSWAPTAPRFASGGPVGSQPSGAVSDSGGTTLHLTLNGRSVGPVRGSRDTINGLVAALREVERGIL